MDQDIVIQPTPNPNALKFITESPVLLEGKVTYRAIEECTDNLLAQKLFALRAVDTIHFFQNVITITKFSYEYWDELEENIIKIINENILSHNPDIKIEDPEKKRRESLSPELKQIEEILDARIRPGLQGDGGDIQCIDFKENVLIVKYEGACGTCPSSSMGTLEAIRSILKDEYNPDIEVYIAPE